MNRKKIIGIIIIWAVAISALCANYMFIENYLGIRLPDRHCMDLFGVYPEEFMNTDFEFYKETGDFRKKAHISEDGELMLPLSRYQAQAWKKTEWLSGFSEYPDKKPFSISSDFKKLTVYIPYDADIESAEYQSTLKQVYTIFQKMAVLQVLDGIPEEEVGMQYTVVDEATGEVFWTQYVKWASSDY